MERLVPRWEYERRLRDAGFRTAADVWGLSPERIAARANVPLRMADALLRTLGELAAIPEERLAALSRHPECVVPGILRLPTATLAALAAARTLDGEVQALVGHLGDRNREAVLRLWGARGLPVPTRAAMARELGVSGSRVQQIVGREDERLRWSGLRLPAGTAAVELLEAAGGVLPGRDLVGRLAASGLVDDARYVHALPHLSRLELVPPVGYAAFADHWFIPDPEPEPDDLEWDIPDFPLVDEGSADRPRPSFGFGFGFGGSLGPGF
jgi:hypothetical protein